MKVGFIGTGNMGSAIMGGIISKKIVEASDIMAYDVMEISLDRVVEEYGIVKGTDNKAVADFADVLIIAVKPQYGEAVLKEIKETVGQETVVVSIMAGRSIEYLESILGADKKIVRTMPNTPALVLEAMTAVTANANVSNADLESVMDIFNGFGKAKLIGENLMDAVTAVSGSSPAYVFMFIEAMADAAVREGMTRADAYLFAAQSVMGSAKMVLETGKHPGELKDMVCSPAGTTIEAVKVLEEQGFRGTVMDAVCACAEKSKNM